MGCAPIKKQAHFQRKQSLVGILRIYVLGLYINQDIKVKVPSIRLRISNQQFTTSNAPIIGANQNKQGDCFSFIINSFYKPNGRALEIGCFDGQTNICFGAFDLGLLLEHRKSQEFRCILNQKQVQMGYVLARGQFQALPFVDLTFRFETVTIRRKNSSFLGDKNEMVAVRLTIGEEALETQFQKDAQQKPPVWQDKKYNYKVPQGLLRALVQLINLKGETLGQCQLSVEEMLKVKQDIQVLQSQQLFLKKHQAQMPIIVADLKYSFVLGRNPIFLPRNQLYSTSFKTMKPMNEAQNAVDKVIH